MLRQRRIGVMAQAAPVLTEQDPPSQSGCGVFLQIGRVTGKRPYYAVIPTPIGYCTVKVPNSGQ